MCVFVSTPSAAVILLRAETICITSQSRLSFALLFMEKEECMD